MNSSSFINTLSNQFFPSGLSTIITFPNADDSQTVIGDESALEDWKAKTLKRFGNVEMEFNNEAKNWFDRVKVNNDAFGDAKAGFAKGKQDFIDKERELGRSID